MDIPAKETLESAFKKYRGTMLFVSHDRYFIKQVADAILVFEKDSVMYYPFGYDHYVSRLKASQDGNLPALMQAKDQAMVEALAAVPKPERHQTRQLSTEEAYLEWKLGLAEEPVLKLADKAEGARKKLDEAGYALACEQLMQAGTYDESQGMDNYDDTLIKIEYNKLKESYEEICKKWTDECIKWYDVYLDEV